MPILIFPCATCRHKTSFKSLLKEQAMQISAKTNSTDIVKFAHANQSKSRRKSLALAYNSYLESLNRFYWSSQILHYENNFIPFQKLMTLTTVLTWLRKRDMLTLRFRYKRTFHCDTIEGWTWYVTRYLAIYSLIEKSSYNRCATFSISDSRLYFNYICPTHNYLDRNVL